MISELTKLDGSPVQELVIKELNTLYRKREFMPVRYTWSSLKMVATYLSNCHGYLQGQSPEYVDSILNPYNEPECAFIFDAVQRMAKGEDLQPLRTKVKLDNQRLSRWIKRFVSDYEQNMGFMSRLKNKLGGKS